MPKIKPGSRKQLELRRKQALRKRNFRLFVKIDFRLFKLKNKLPSDTPIWRTEYSTTYNY